MSALDVPTADPAVVFAQLYADLHAPALARIRRTVRSHEAAEDVMQRAWEKVFTALPEYLGRPGFHGRGLVYTTADRVALDHLRKGQSAAAGGRVQFVPLDVAVGGTGSEPTGHTELNRLLLARCRDDASPEHTALAAEQVSERQALAGVLLEGLPQRERAPLWWHDFGGRTYVEVAERLGLTVSAVKMVIYRARLRLDRLVTLDARQTARGGGTVARFWASVGIGGPEACWPWLGCSQSTKLGGGVSVPSGPLMRVGGVAGSMVNAWRVAYALRHGVIPPLVRPVPVCAGGRGAVGDGGAWCMNPVHLAATRWDPKGGGAVPLTAAELRLAAAPPRGRALAARRRALGLSQRAFAAQTGLYHTEVTKVELECVRYRLGLGALSGYVRALDRLERERAAGEAA